MKAKIIKYLLAFSLFVSMLISTRVVDGNYYISAPAQISLSDYSVTMDCDGPDGVMLQ